MPSTLQKDFFDISTHHHIFHAIHHIFPCSPLNTNTQHLKLTLILNSLPHFTHHLHQTSPSSTHNLHLPQPFFFIKNITERRKHVSLLHVLKPHITYNKGHLFLYSHTYLYCTSYLINNTHFFSFFKKKREHTRITAPPPSQLQTAPTSFKLTIQPPPRRARASHHLSSYTNQVNNHPQFR